MVFFLSEATQKGVSLERCSMYRALFDVLLVYQFYLRMTIKGLKDVERVCRLPNYPASLCKFPGAVWRTRKFKRPNLQVRCYC